MKQLKHTQGPWVIDKFGVNNPDIMRNGRRVAVVISDYPHGPITEDANARLIAAAPEMLDALIYFCKRVEEGSIRSRKTFSYYKKVIQKATGYTWEELTESDQCDYGTTP